MLKKISLLNRGTYIGTINDIMFYSLTYTVSFDIWGIISTSNGRFPCIYPDQEFEIYYLEADQVKDNKVIDRKYFLVSSRYRLVLEAFDWLKYYSKKRKLSLHHIGTALHERKTGKGLPTPFPSYSDFDGTIKTRIFRLAKESKLITDIGKCSITDTCFSDPSNPGKFVDTVIREMAAARTELADVLTSEENI